MENNKQILALLANDFQKLSTQLHEIDFGKEMQVLRPTVDSLALITSALSLKEASPSFCIGLDTASIGLNTQNSAGGLFSPPFAVGIKVFSEMLHMITHSEPDAGTLKLSSLLIGTMLLSVATLTSLATTNKEGNLLPFDLSLHIATSAGIVDHVSRGIVEAIGASENTKDAATSALAFVAVNVMILTASLNNSAAAIALTESLSPQLSQWLQDIEPFINTAIQERRIQGHAANVINLLIQEGKIALDNKDYETFVHLMTNMYGSFSTEKEVGTQDSRQPLHALTDVIRNHILVTPELEKQWKTGVVQI